MRQKLQYDHSISVHFGHTKYLVAVFFKRAALRRALRMLRIYRPDRVYSTTDSTVEAAA